jgi:hypothetical protein
VDGRRQTTCPQLTSEGSRARFAGDASLGLSAELATEFFTFANELPGAPTLLGRRYAADGVPGSLVGG